MAAINVFIIEKLFVGLYVMRELAVYAILLLENMLRYVSTDFGRFVRMEEMPPPTYNTTYVHISKIYIVLNNTMWWCCMHVICFHTMAICFYTPQTAQMHGGMCNIKCNKCKEFFVLHP